MKKLIFLLPIALLAYACNTPVKESAPPESSSVTLPYTATYSSQWNQDISDQDLLTVLNSYKAWETGDMQMLRATFGDSLSFVGWDGTVYSGPTEGLTDKWAAARDTISTIKIEIGAWTKNHSVDKKADFIVVWYKEIDTYKSGRIDSADWHDINLMSKGKISWYSQYRRPFKAK